MSLKGLSYGDKLVDELFAHSTKMEKMYESISNLLATGSNNDEKYSKFINLYKDQSQWFEKAKAVGPKNIKKHRDIIYIFVSVEFIGLQLQLSHSQLHHSL